MDLTKIFGILKLVMYVIEKITCKKPPEEQTSAKKADGKKRVA